MSNTDRPPRPSIPRAVLLAPLALVVLLALGWAFMAYSARGPLAGDSKHDFGVIEILAKSPPDEPTDITLTYTFHLTNRTSKTLVLKSARPDCGCLSVGGAFPMTISPDGPVDLPITMRIAAAAPSIVAAGSGAQGTAAPSAATSPIAATAPAHTQTKTVLIHLDFGDDGIQVLRVKAATTTK